MRILLTKDGCCIGNSDGPSEIPSVFVGWFCGSRDFSFTCVLNVGEGDFLAGKTKFRERRGFEEKEREERESEFLIRQMVLVIGKMDGKWFFFVNMLFKVEIVKLIDVFTFLIFRV